MILLLSIGHHTASIRCHSLSTGCDILTTDNYTVFTWCPTVSAYFNSQFLYINFHKFLWNRSSLITLLNLGIGEYNEKIKK